MEQLHYRPAAPPIPKPTPGFHACAAFLAIVLLAELILPIVFWETAVLSCCIFFLVNLCAVMPTVLYCAIETSWPRPRRLIITAGGVITAGLWMSWTALVLWRFLHSRG